ncbi:MAG: TlpA family protein disulfide reductase [Nitrospinae bacterium]|nr:TlpA family protein disulfide reductase [Nitrospinota bacterium]
MRKKIGAIGFAFLFLFASSAYAGAPKAGDMAPDFSVVSLKGEKLELSSLKGKVVLMGMFHICVPCMNQALEFEKVRKQIGPDKLQIIGVNTHGDSKDDVAGYLSEFPSPINFPYYVDSAMSVNKAYVQRDMPTVLIIDKEGVIRLRSPSLRADQLVALLKKLL